MGKILQNCPLPHHKYKESGDYLKDIIKDIEKKILYCELKNDKEVLTSYILEYYK